MRRERDIGVFAERMIRGQRFLGENIQAGGGDFAGIQRRKQIVFDDDFAASAIHDADFGLHFRERRGVQHAFGLLGHRHVDGDEIRVAINRVKFSDQFHAHGFGAGFREERIIREHAHAEGDGALGHFAADAAHAENAERLFREFDALKQLAIPFAGHHGCMGLRDLAREAQKHCEG